MENSNSLSVAVLGASDRRDRYAYKAIKMLRQHGHAVYPVTPREISLDGLIVYPTVRDVPQPIHTVTLYVNPMVLESLADAIMDVRPSRVIFNPGTEHPEIEDRFRDVGIEVREACTLVLLSTGRFGSD